MRYVILTVAIGLAGCEAPEPDKTAAETITEEQAIADAEAMIAENTERARAEMPVEAAEGENR